LDIVPLRLRRLQLVHADAAARAWVEPWLLAVGQRLEPHADGTGWSWRWR
jgi:hypothetical protein